MGFGIKSLVKGAKKVGGAMLGGGLASVAGNFMGNPMKGGMGAASAFTRKFGGGGGQPQAQPAQPIMQAARPMMATAPRVSPYQQMQAPQNRSRIGMMRQQMQQQMAQQQQMPQQQMQRPQMRGGRGVGGMIRGAMGGSGPRPMMNMPPMGGGRGYNGSGIGGGLPPTMRPPQQQFNPPANMSLDPNAGPTGGARGGGIMGPGQSWNPNRLY